MSNRVFVTADLHFGHSKVQTLRGFTDEELVERWNEVVRKRDVVYVLGDVFKLNLVHKLNGTKKLALGNHDQYPAERYLQHFTQVRAMFEWDNCLLTHMPVHPNQLSRDDGLPGRYRLNIHGHMHANEVTVPKLSGEAPDHRYRCVSLERTDFRPVLLREIADRG